MKDILKKKSGRMTPEVYSSMQSVRYFLRAKNMSSVEYFSRPDTNFSPVSSNLVKNMKAAWKISNKDWDVTKKANDKYLAEHRIYVKVQAAAHARRMKEKALFHSNKKFVKKRIFLKTHKI